MSSPQYRLYQKMGQQHQEQNQRKGDRWKDLDNQMLLNMLRQNVDEIEIAFKYNNNDVSDKIADAGNFLAYLYGNNVPEENTPTWALLKRASTSAADKATTTISPEQNEKASTSQSLKEVADLLISTPALKAKFEALVALESAPTSTIMPSSRSVEPTEGALKTNSKFFVVP